MPTLNITGVVNNLGWDVHGHYYSASPQISKEIKSVGVEESTNCCD